VSLGATRFTGAATNDGRSVAVIDLGSNSWRLVVFSYGDGWWRRTDELYENVRVGAGLAESGRLSDEAVARGLETLSVFAHFCQAHALARDDVHVVATSAIREASNSEEFLRAAEQRSGLRIEVLSEEAEAWLGYLAAVNTSTLTDGAVLEIGGGSLQLIRVAGRRAYERPSFPLGAVRVTEELMSGPGPTRKRELEAVRARAESLLAEHGWFGADLGTGRLVGLGGAVRNLAAAAMHAAEYPDLGVQGFVLTRKVLTGLVRKLAALPVTERALWGIKPGREDIILAAALVIERVVKLGGFDGIEVTEAGLREGVFFARTLFADWDGRNPVFANVRRAAVTNLAIQYESDMTHVEHVARLSLQMFDSLTEQGVIEPLPGERELLWAAAMLHDVGMTIAYDDHHKHSQYLILSAQLPGFDPRERALIACIARYHRKGIPKLGELARVAQPKDEDLIARCAVIVRLAEHLERGRDQAVSEVLLRRDGDEISLHATAPDENVALPHWSVDRYGDGETFARVFGRKLLIA
jgi:exopolyphosphatase/guanosine-5'-triphosphate,3'-diphosphate pyrophosphatase